MRVLDWLVAGPFTFLDPDTPQRGMRCAGCKKPIAVGTRYVRCVGPRLESGVHPWHPECWDRKAAKLKRTEVRRQARRTARFYRARGGQ